jgi:hypothetical protein
MNPQLIQAVAQSRQQELLRQAQSARLADELPRRRSAIARFLQSIPSPSSSRGRSPELSSAAQATSA